MNDLTVLNHMTNDQFLTHLQHHLSNRQLLDEHRNLSLAESSEQDFLELFFLEKIFIQISSYPLIPLKRIDRMPKHCCIF